GGADPVADAAAVGQAVFPGTADITRPGAVTLVDANSWQDGVAASVLFSPPLRAPVLLTRGSTVPPATGSALSALNPQGEPKTGAALKAHSMPDIYILGPESVVSKTVEDALRKLGKTVTRIQGPDPVTNAIAFARYTNGKFGWGVVDPGHGLVFASQQRPLD